jgi:hypothetical protein
LKNTRILCFQTLQYYRKILTEGSKLISAFCCMVHIAVMLRRFACLFMHTMNTLISHIMLWNLYFVSNEIVYKGYIVYLLQRTRSVYYLSPNIVTRQNREVFKDLKWNRIVSQDAFQEVLACKYAWNSKS